jgi:ABC-2 type transport system ATP-binding protein
MTGRENIYMNASIFGLTRKEIDQRLKYIIEFSELGEYIDSPVRTYSSGMYMRLAFSVAINVNADILLIDEILAVGDANFQAKCFSKLREIKASGTTIVIVSHSLTQIEQICDRSIWLKDGLVYQVGAPRDVHIQYLDYMGQKRYDTEKNNQPQEEETVSDNDKNIVHEKDEHKEPDNKLSEIVNEMPPAKKRLRWGSGDAKIISVKLFDSKGNEKYTFKTGESMRIHIDYEAKRNLEKPAIGIGIFRNDGLQCFGTNTQIDGVNNIQLNNHGIIDCYIEHNTLIEGDFLLDVAIHTEDGFAYDYYKEAKCFKTYGTVNDVGVVHLDHKWEIFLL